MPVEEEVMEGFGGGDYGAPAEPTGPSQAEPVVSALRDSVPSAAAGVKFNEALARLKAPLRVDAFNAISAGKPDFTAMIVRDDEPGCSSILAQQMSDQTAEDVVTVINHLATQATETLSAQALSNAKVILEACAKVAEDELVEIFHDSPEIDTVCNSVVRNIAKSIRGLRLPNPAQAIEARQGGDTHVAPSSDESAVAESHAPINHPLNLKNIIPCEKDTGHG